MLFRCSSIGLVALAALSISVKASGPGNGDTAQGGSTQPATILHADPTDSGAQPVQKNNPVGPNEANNIRKNPKGFLPVPPRYTQDAHDGARELSQEQASSELVKRRRSRQRTSVGRGTQPARDTRAYLTDEERRRIKEAESYLFNGVKAWAGIKDPVLRARRENGGKSSRDKPMEKGEKEAERIEEVKKEGTVVNLDPLRLPDIRRFVAQYVKSQPLPVLMEYTSQMKAHSVQGTQSGVTDKERQTRETAENNHFDVLKAEKGDTALDESDQAILRLEAHLYAQLQSIASLETYNRDTAAHSTTPAGHNAQSTQDTATGMSDEARGVPIIIYPKEESTSEREMRKTARKYYLVEVQDAMFGNQHPTKAEYHEAFRRAEEYTQNTPISEIEEYVRQMKGFFA